MKKPGKNYAQSKDGKEALKKAGKKYAQTKDGKEALKKAGKKYVKTDDGVFAKLMAQERYREKLGERRRKAQYRRYQQTQIDKARGGNALRRRTRFQKAVLRGPEYVCSCCHRSLFKKSVDGVTENMREKIRLASEKKVQADKEENCKAEATFKETSSSKFQETTSSKFKERGGEALKKRKNLN